jgi:hypothetical protein
MLWPWAVIGIALWNPRAAHSMEVREGGGEDEWEKRIEFKAAGLLGSHKMSFDVATQLKVEGVEQDR